MNTCVYTYFYLYTLFTYWRKYKKLFFKFMFVHCKKRKLNFLSLILLVLDLSYSEPFEFFQYRSPLARYVIKCSKKSKMLQKMQKNGPFSFYFFRIFWLNGLLLWIIKKKIWTFLKFSCLFKYLKFHFFISILT